MTDLVLNIDFTSPIILKFGFNFLFLEFNENLRAPLQTLVEASI